METRPSAYSKCREARFYVWNSIESQSGRRDTGRTASQSAAYWAFAGRLGRMDDKTGAFAVGGVAVRDGSGLHRHLCRRMALSVFAEEPWSGLRSRRRADDGRYPDCSSVFTGWRPERDAGASLCDDDLCRVYRRILWDASGGTASARLKIKGKNDRIKGENRYVDLSGTIKSALPSGGIGTGTLPGGACPNGYSGEAAGENRYDRFNGVGILHDTGTPKKLSAKIRFSQPGLYSFGRSLSFRCVFVRRVTGGL